MAMNKNQQGNTTIGKKYKYWQRNKVERVFEFCFLFFFGLLKIP